MISERAVKANGKVVQLRWKRSGIVHCARSETVWRKWLSHCQVFWVGKEVDERIKLAQCCL